MSVPGLPLFSTQTVITATPAKVGATGQRRLMKVVLYPAAANSTCEFKNGATDTGDVLLTVSTIANGPSGVVDLTDVGGLLFTTAIWCNVTGTGAIAYVWYD